MGDEPDTETEADDDQGIAEAMRRDAGMERDPSLWLTLEELKASLGR